MPSELDRQYDDGAGGGDRARTAAVQLGRDAQGRAIVTNLPRDLADPVRRLLDAPRRDARRWSPATSGSLSPSSTRRRRSSPACARRRLERRQGRPGRDRDAQLPGLDRLLHGGDQGRRHRHPGQRLVAGGRDAARACAGRARADHRRRAARQAGSRPAAARSRSSSLPVERPLAEALAPLLGARRRGRPARRSRPRTTPPSCSPPARPASPRARSRPIAPSPPRSMLMRSAC